MKTIILHGIGNTIDITLSGSLTNEEKIALGKLLFGQSEVDNNGQIVFYSNLKKEGDKIIDLQE